MILDSELKFSTPLRQGESALSDAKIAAELARQRLMPFFTNRTIWLRFINVAKALRPERDEGKSEILRMLESRIHPLQQSENEAKAALAALTARQDISLPSDDMVEQAAVETMMSGGAPTGDAPPPMQTEVRQQPPLNNNGSADESSAGLPSTDGINGPREESEVFSDPLPAFESEAMAMLHELSTAEARGGTDGSSLRTDGGFVTDGGIFSVPSFQPRQVDVSIPLHDVDEYHDAVEDLEEDDGFQEVSRRNKKTRAGGGGGGGGGGKGAGSKSSNKKRGDIGGKQ